MTTDISIIRKELEHFQEIKDPTKIKPNTSVKYITLKGDIERFYTGGKYCACKNNKILLKNNSGKEWSVPIEIIIKKNKYNSHFYIPCNNIDEKCLEDNKDNELKKIIDSQQTVINKMSIKNCKLEKAFEEYKCRAVHYEQLLQDGRYELEKYKINEKDLEFRVKEYERVINNLIQ